MDRNAKSSGTTFVLVSNGPQLMRIEVELVITHRALDKSTAIRKSRAWTQPDARSRSKNLMLKMVENRISLGKDTSCYFVFRGLRMLPEMNCRRSRGQHVTRR